MPETMQALVAQSPNQLELLPVQMPRHDDPFSALVQIEVCGICNSTDHKLVEGTMGWGPPFPFVLGHESVGRVVSVGERVRTFRVGDRVTRPIYLPPTGEACRSANGGFAQFGVVRDAPAMTEDGDVSLARDYNALRQIVVPAHLSSRDAALCISLSETASVLRHLPNPRGLTVAVAGVGVAGLAFILWLKMAGAGCVIALGRRDARLQKAREMGADVVINTQTAQKSGTQIATVLHDAARGKPLDGIIEATGDAALAAEMLGALHPNGFSCAYGIPPKGTNYPARYRQAVVEEHLSYHWVADLLARGWIKSEWFVSHEWPFASVMEAFHQAESGDVIKGFVFM